MHELLTMPDMQFNELTEELTDQLYNFINLGLQRNLQTSLPKKSDSMSVNHIRESSEDNWKNYIADHHTNLTEVISFYMSSIKKSLLKQT